jgi:5-methylcytosine-specific restriction protein A
VPVHTCTRPGCPEKSADPNHRGPCERHARADRLHRTRTTPTKRTRDWTEINRRRAAVKAWRDKHGDWCPGHGRPGHASSDLTADHVTPIARGGDPRGPLQVLCRSCNSRRGAGP